MHDRRRWFLIVLAALTLAAAADLYWNRSDFLRDFAKGFSTVEGPRTRIH